MQLRQDQQDQIDAAKALLNSADKSYDAGELAGRVGRLEWHLGSMLHLISDMQADR